MTDTRVVDSDLRPTLDENVGTHTGSKRGGFIEGQLMNQGFDFSVPAEYTRIPLGGDVAKKDELMQIPTENDQVRRFLAEELSTAIRHPEDGDWIFIYGDANQLKLANSRSRSLGDMAIVYTVSVIVQSLKNANLSRDTRVYLVKNGGSGCDEVFAFVFGTSKDVIERLENSFASLRPVTAKIQNKENEKSKIDFEFSSMVSVVSGYDENIAEKLEGTRDYLLRSPNNIAWDFYNLVKSSADEKVMLKKSDEQKALIENNPRTYFTDLIKALVKKYGGGRVSMSALEVMLRSVALEAISAAASGEPDLFTDVCVKLRINEEEFRKAQTADDLYRLYGVSFQEEAR